MEQKSFEKTEPKTKKGRFNLYVPGTKSVFLARDFNCCVLVIPEGVGVHKNITLHQGRFLEYHL